MMKKIKIEERTLYTVQAESLNTNDQKFVIILFSAFFFSNHI